MEKEAVRVEALHKSFGHLEVLKGVSLYANQGEVIAIIGGSGSGKSTILRCINFLETPSQGTVYIEGEAIKTQADGNPSDQKQLERIRSKLAMVFQQFNLWSHMTIMENIIEVPIHVLGIKKSLAIEQAHHLLKRVGLTGKENAYPAFLSGGQQQRAAIARALAVNPKVMLFDEPTSALDPELVGEVLAVMRDLASEGRTMLVVTHEMKFAREVASHVVYLYNGQIEEEGKAKEIFDNPQSPRLQKFLQTIN